MVRRLRNQVPSIVTGALTAAIILGVHACGSENNSLLGTLRTLGIVEGPSKAEMAEVFGSTCALEDVECDGEIAAVVMGAEAKGLPESYDDDLWALVFGALGVFAVEDLQPILDSYEMLRDDAVPNELAPGQEFTFGPVSGQVNLSDACAPGVGSVVYSKQETFLGEGAAGDDIRGVPGSPVGWIEIVTISLVNCRIEGTIDDIAGTDFMVVSGTGTSTTEVDDGFGITESIGSFQINPGLVESTGDAEPIWGFSEVIAYDLTLSASLSAGADLEGGFCYGGTGAASEEQCEGIYITYQEFVDAELPVPPDPE